MTFFARHISISIDKPANEVYDFVSNPENLPKWAAGLSGSIRKEGEDWVAESPMGKVKVKFADKNRFGVLDHYVTLPAGIDVYNPMRVCPNEKGSELIFTLYKFIDMTEKQFNDDAKMVEKDLRKLKEFLEK